MQQSAYRFWLTVLVASGFVLTQLSASLYLPAMPHMVSALRSTSHHIMLTLAVFFFGYAIGQLFWGTLSDYIGRKRALLAAIGIYVVLVAFLPTRQSVVGFSLIFVWLGFMAAAFTGVGNAIVKDSFPKEKVKKTIASIEVAMAVAPSVAPIIGSHLLYWFNWQAIFVFLAIYSVVLFVGVAVFMQETHKHTTRQAEKASVLVVYKRLLSNTQFLAYILTLGLLFGVFFGYLDVSPFIFQTHLHVSARVFGWLFFAATFTYAVGTFCVRQWVQRLGTERLSFMGLVIVVVASALLLLLPLLLASKITAVVLPTMLLMFGLGLLLPSTKAGAMTVFQTHSGAAASLMKFSQTGLCVVILALVANMHSHMQLYPIFLALFLVASLGFIVFVILIKQSKQQEVVV